MVIGTPVANDPLPDLLTPRGLRDPESVWSAVRRRDRVWRSEVLDSWVVADHATCAAVLLDAGRFCSDWRRIGDDVPPSALSVQTLDPPAHTAARKLLVAAFRARDWQGFARRVDDRVRARLDAVARRPSFDFMADFAAPLALEAVTDLLGADPPDTASFAGPSSAIVDSMDYALRPETATPGRRARAELAELTGGWLAHPTRDGMIAFLAAHRDDRVDEGVLRNSLRVVLHSGYESASRLLGNALLACLDEPGTLERFADGVPDAALQELVRLAGPVQAEARGCVADTELAGRPIRAGETVTVLLGAANRDPDVFREPGALRFDRVPNPHLGFGRGPHACPGSTLALVLARAVLTAAARDHRGLRLVAEPVFRRNATLRGLERLVVATG